MELIEVINGIMLIIAGMASAALLATKKANNSKRMRTVPSAILAVGIIIKGVDHLGMTDGELGTVSDFMIWFGMLMMVATYIIRHHWRAKPR